MRTLFVLALALCVHGSVSAQTEALSAPYPTAPVAGVAGDVINSAPHAGANALGIAHDSATDSIIVCDLFSGSAFVYDLNLVNTGTFVHPGGINTVTGVAYNSVSNSLFFVDMTALTVYETDMAGGLIASTPLVLPTPTSLIGGITYNSAANTFWVDDIVSDQYFEYDTSWTLTGQFYANPDNPLGAGAFGNGIGYVTGSIFDVPTGTIADGQVARLYRIDETGAIGDNVSLAGVPDTFLNSNVHHPVGSTGVQVNYIVGNATNSIYEVEATLLDVCTYDPITDLDCVSGGPDVTLTWTNNGSYTGVSVYRDGVLLSSLPGTATSYADLGLANGPYTYRVTSTTSGEECFGGTCGVYVADLASATDVIWDPSAALGGAIDSGAAVNAALAFSGRVPVSVADIVGLDLSSIENLWVVLGTFPANQALSPDQGQALADFILAGTGANPKGLYINSSDTWGFDAPTAIDTYDGTSAVGDGAVGCDVLAFQGFDTPEGLALSVTGAGTNDATECSYIDQLIPDFAGASIAQSDLAGVINTMIGTDGAAAALGDYRVVAHSTEFGGFIGDQEQLMVSILAFFGDTGTGGGPEFVRGDANADSTFDISDAVFSLAALFVPGAPSPGCLDSADSNDDGTFDISDAVFTLGALFVPGSPAPPEPNPACGEDPSADALDCVSYGPC